MPFVMKKSISSGPTECQKLELGSGIQVEFPNAFEGPNQFGQVRDEAFTANAIADAPAANEGLLDRKGE